MPLLNCFSWVGLALGSGVRRFHKNVDTWYVFQLNRILVTPKQAIFDSRLCTIMSSVKNSSGAGTKYTWYKFFGLSYNFNLSLSCSPRRRILLFCFFVSVLHPPPGLLASLEYAYSPCVLPPFLGSCCFFFFFSSLPFPFSISIWTSFVSCCILVGGVSSFSVLLV